MADFDVAEDVERFLEIEVQQETLSFTDFLGLPRTKKGNERSKPISALNVRFASRAGKDPSLHDQSMTDFDACFRESRYTVARPSLGCQFLAAAGAENENFVCRNAHTSCGKPTQPIRKFVLHVLKNVLHV